jgi:hypothetical protein
LPEFFEAKTIEYEVYVSGKDVNMNYDMIIGRDIMTELGIILDYDQLHSIWEESSVPMKQTNANIKQTFRIQDSHVVDDTMERFRRILDAKYEPANLDQIVAQCNRLSNKQKEDLRKLLEKFKSIKE